MKKPGYDILGKLERTDFKRARKLMVNAVLGTDMAKHMNEVSKFKNKVSTTEFDPATGDKEFALTMMFHLADISNSTKGWDLCKKWCDLLFVEFFN